MQWLEEMTGRFPNLEADRAWAALHDYLAKAFLRHGIQVAIFLDPSVELPTDYTASLTILLAEAVQSQFDSTRQESARHAISDFLTSVGKNPDRAQFIAECADRAANYFSLAVSPDVAARFSEKLSPLKIFCDTNFLFGILDLHVHPLVEVSNRLIEAIAKHKLPLSLQYHEATLHELQSSIAHYGDKLQKHRWTQSLSRAATTSRFMSGIELKYHQKNAESVIDADVFLRPYQYVDELLKWHKISKYEPPTERLTERATLEAEYKDYLTRRRKEKDSKLISHDVTVLDCVRSLRNSATYTIEAGALFMTCDYTLYQFDSEASLNANVKASVLLPNILWQILRPFIPTSQDFDRSFAETFAIPEFRTIGSGASKACSKMLGLLVAYKDIPEDIAVRLLSNDLLIGHLCTAESDEQFQAQIELAIASEYHTLLEERAALAGQVEVLQSEKERTKKELEEQKQAAALEAAKAQEAIKAKEKEIEALAVSHRDAELEVKDTSAKLDEVETAKDVAEKATKQEAKRRQDVEVLALRSAKIASIIVAILVSLTFELVVHYVWHWDWLLQHPKSYGLQICVCLMASFGIVGLWVRPWRKALWGTGISGLLFVALQILDGSTKTQ